MKLAMIAIALLGCESTRGVNEPAKPPPAPPVVATGAIDPALAAIVRDTAVAYAEWGRVDEQPRQAPTDCAPPTGSPEGRASRVRVSAAEDGPHGAKLYFLYASDRDAYLNHRAGVGFKIVKEAFQAVPATAAPHAARPSADYVRAPPPIRTVDVDGKPMTTGAPTGLFVMAKVGTPDSDAGWIYGTTAPDGTVTSAGRVTSCMGCHEDAPSDRLFGVRIVD